jgi:(2R)-sulfolactate sulfo-lyase subunit beta
MNLSKSTFWGYKRENGRSRRAQPRHHPAGRRPVERRRAGGRDNIKGTMALPHPYGRLQFGADLDLHFRTLIGTGSNPNVAAVVVIGIEDGWAKKVADGIAATGKPVRTSASSARRPRHHPARLEGARNSCSRRASCAEKNGR